MKRSCVVAALLMLRSCLLIVCACIRLGTYVGVGADSELKGAGNMNLSENVITTNVSRSSSNRYHEDLYAISW
jgi:hypothetical protein